MSNPARAAVAPKNSATRCSPARAACAGRNAGFTLGSAISSRKSFSVLFMPALKEIGLTLRIEAQGVENQDCEPRTGRREVCSGTNLMEFIILALCRRRVCRSGIGTGRAPPKHGQPV